MFQLLIPEGEDITVFDRADALSGWVNHFLLGLGMLQPKLAQVKDEVGKPLTTCVISLNWDMTRMKIKKNWRNH